MSLLSVYNPAAGYPVRTLHLGAEDLKIQEGEPPAMWQINEQEYFEAPGLSALFFHNNYMEGKQGGLELIQHGERIATNGAVFLEPTPHQWSPLVEAGPRQIDAGRNQARVSLTCPALEAACTMRLWAEGESLGVAVDLERPLPTEWVGKVGLNLEIFPEAYLGKTYQLGETFGVFPRQPTGPVTFAADGSPTAAPLAEGQRLVIAAEDPLRLVTIESRGSALALYDGRSRIQNGWFVVRALLSAGVTTGAAEWRITLNSVPAWRRPPVIAISQVGYHPDQVKQAVLELDPRSEMLEAAVLERIELQGPRPVLTAAPRRWGKFLRYEYAIFDFSAECRPGLYRVRYGDHLSAPFRIGRDVYQNGVWQPTLETFLPVQMCHMDVRDGYRVWHGACHLDDALQAPPNHEHFDGYRQGPDCAAAPLKHIDGLDRGGWHDAGDDDLAAGSQAATVHLLALAREEFGVDTDQTTIDRVQRIVRLHQPDGAPDILQQIEHGVENLLAGYRTVGHSFAGIISGSLEQYTLTGDTASMTDNCIYDPALAPAEQRGRRSGRRDDRWVFTSEDTGREYRVAAALAAAGRVLRQYAPALADECLRTASYVWEREHGREPVTHPSAYNPRPTEVQDLPLALELLQATGATVYRERLLTAVTQIERNLDASAWIAVRAMPLLNDPGWAGRVRQMLEPYSGRLRSDLAVTPFGIPYTPALWGWGWSALWFAVQHYYLCRAFPDLFDREIVLRVVNYVLGCHPASDLSLVSGVGARSVISAYGYNRADWSYIPGGNVSGPNLIRPDFPELKQPFPFLWQQAEYVIGGAASYIFCVLAADKLLNG